MSAILGIMTALAILFGCLRWMNAFPVVYLFFGLLTVVICLVQMFYGKTPRGASAVAGAILLPVFAFCASWFYGDGEADAIMCALLMGVPFGGLLGYLTGTMAAGIFLVMDKLEPYLQGQRPASAKAAHSVPSS
jgi:hypothetical protein